MRPFLGVEDEVLVCAGEGVGAFGWEVDFAVFFVFVVALFLNFADQWGHVIDAGDPFCGEGFDEVAADADLDAVVIEGFAIEGAFGVPLDVDFGVVKEGLPAFVGAVDGGFWVCEDAGFECVIKGSALDVDAEDTRLAGLLSPLTAVHEPKEGGFDPGHAVVGEWVDELLGCECGVGDGVVVGLVDDDGVFCVVGADGVEHGGLVLRSTKVG